MSINHKEKLLEIYQNIHQIFLTSLVELECIQRSLLMKFRPLSFFDVIRDNSNYLIDEYN